MATQGALVRDLNFFTGPIFAEKNYNRYLTNTSLTGAWDLTTTDSTGSTTGVFQAIADPELLPLLASLQVTANGLTRRSTGCCRISARSTWTRSSSAPSSRPPACRSSRARASART